MRRLAASLAFAAAATVATAATADARPSCSLHPTNIGNPVVIELGYNPPDSTPRTIWTGGMPITLQPGQRVWVRRDKPLGYIDAANAIDIDTLIVQCGPASSTSTIVTTTTTTVPAPPTSTVERVTPEPTTTTAVGLGTATTMVPLPVVITRELAFTGARGRVAWVGGMLAAGGIVGLAISGQINARRRGE